MERSTSVLIWIIVLLLVLVTNGRADIHRPRELLEKPVYTRNIININTFPLCDFNGDGIITAGDAHVDIAYNGVHAAYVGIFISYADYQENGCYDDAWMAIARVFMVSNTVRRIFSPNLYNWWGDVGVSIQDEVYPSDDWIRKGWLDNARISSIYGCGYIIDDGTKLSGLPYTRNPWQDVLPSGRNWITAYSIEVLQDYNRDGRYGEQDNSDAWIQISWPRNASGPVDIWVTTWDNTTGQVYSQGLLYDSAQTGVTIYWPEVPGDALHADKVVRAFINVASGIHDVHTCVEVVIPDGEPYAGDLLAYVLFSEDGVAYESLAPNNELPIEY